MIEVISGGGSLSRIDIHSHGFVDGTIIATLEGWDSGFYVDGYSGEEFWGHDI